MKSRPKKLTEKQRKFVENLALNGGNKYRAAIDAGYTESFALTSSNKLAKHTNLQAPIKESTEKTQSIFSKEVLEKLRISALHTANNLATIIYDILPNPVTGDIGKPNLYRVAISAMHELNKMLGFHAPDRAVKLNIDATKEKLKEVQRIYEDY